MQVKHFNQKTYLQLKSHIVAYFIPYHKINSILNSNWILFSCISYLHGSSFRLRLVGNKKRNSFIYW